MDSTFCDGVSRMSVNLAGVDGTDTTQQVIKVGWTTAAMLLGPIVPITSSCCVGWRRAHSAPCIKGSRNRDALLWKSPRNALPDLATAACR